MSREEKQRKSSIFKAKALTAKVMGHLKRTRKWHGGGAGKTEYFVADDNEGDEDEDEGESGDGRKAEERDEDEKDVEPEGQGPCNTEDHEQARVVEDTGNHEAKTVEDVEDERDDEEEGAYEDEDVHEDETERDDDRPGSSKVATFASWKRNFEEKAREKEESRKNEMRNRFETKRKRFSRTRAKVPVKRSKVRLVKDEVTRHARAEPARNVSRRRRARGVHKEKTTTEREEDDEEEAYAGREEGTNEAEEEEAEEEEVGPGPATSALDEAFHQLFVKPYAKAVAQGEGAVVPEGSGEEKTVKGRGECAEATTKVVQVEEELVEEEEKEVNVGTEHDGDNNNDHASRKRQTSASHANSEEEKEQTVAERLRDATAPFEMGEDGVAAKMQNAMRKARSVAVRQEQNRRQKEEADEEEEDDEDEVSRVLISDYLVGDDGGIDPEKKRRDVIRRLKQRTKLHAAERRRARIRAKISAKAAWKQMNSKSASLRSNPLLPYAANSPLEGFVHLPALMQSGLGVAPSLTSAISDEEIDAIVSWVWPIVCVSSSTLFLRCNATSRGSSRGIGT